MRRAGGLALLALGVLSVLLGAALAAAFGPDDRMGTGPHRLSTPGQAILTAPQALAYSGPTVQLSVRSPDPQRELFLGVGHDVDVRDFIADTPHTRIDAIEIPWRLSTTPVGGGGFPKGDPGDVEWWIADARGRGQAVLTWRLPDTAADVVILDPEGNRGLTVDVHAAVVAPGVFVVGLALVVLGLGLAVFGWALLSARTAPAGVHALGPAAGRRARSRGEVQ